eukprot:9885048-Alexandrium_andersonii.AAC.1
MPCHAMPCRAVRVCALVCVCASVFARLRVCARLRSIDTAAQSSEERASMHLAASREVVEGK